MILRVITRKAEAFPQTLLWFNLYREQSTSIAAQLTPEVILNDKVRAECVKRLKILNMSAINQKKKTNKAAVLAPLCIHNGKLGFLYTLRSHKVSMNRGQVSFPGGMKDESDPTMEDTALRETWEELRIPKDAVDVWGSANIIHRKGMSVLPVLGFIGEVDPKSLQVNKNEVEEAFFHPLEKLCDPALCRYTQFRSHYTLPTYFGEKHRIWGLTAIITHLIMNALVPDVYNHKLAYLQPIEGINDRSSYSNEAQNF